MEQHAEAVLGTVAVAPGELLVALGLSALPAVAAQLALLVPRLEGCSGDCGEGIRITGR
jgi:hypothetical protein